MQRPARGLLAAVSLFVAGCAASSGADATADSATADGVSDGVTVDVTDTDAAPLDAAMDAGAGDAADTTADAALPPCGAARVREDLAIPTLDGFTLSAFVDRPAQEACPLPTILIQTPYNKEGAAALFFGDERVARPLFASPHYAFVVVDWRGRFGSSGLPNGGSGAWQAQDSYDTVQWIAQQPWSDGQVGTWGVSALCRAQYRTATGPTANA